ncbi:ExbD/TolR family protein [Actibacterium lipolyticum]|uniref:Biopolymer transport protein ExbD n=1 Tax=Actibacterium lipolyticum TaxID=1524263 RepID=A0A238KFB0_9RHOB|nr:biopolymer transporter ExbD [Actibacterium lipolyticum]SMX41543.1 biopolymer transport protein ExbD [Actibacterium lipolyticum]
MFAFSEPRPKRRPSLTPMIDVVFLLLVFFMLASRFGTDMQLPLVIAGQGGEYSGPPRLIEVRPDGVTLNGVAVALSALAAELAQLTEAPTDAVVLRARDEASLQRLVVVMDTLSAAGFSRIAIVE